MLFDLSVGLNHCNICICLCTRSLFNNNCTFFHTCRDACCCGHIRSGNFAGAVLDRSVCHAQESFCLAQRTPGWYRLLGAYCCLHTICLLQAVTCLHSLHSRCCKSVCDACTHITSTCQPIHPRICIPACALTCSQPNLLNSCKPKLQALCIASLVKQQKFLYQTVACLLSAQ